MKNWVHIICLTALAVSLGACGKKSNKSSTVATPPPAANCVYNAQYGYYTLVGTTTRCELPTGTGQCAFNTQYQQYMITGTTTPCNQNGGNTNCVQSQYGWVDQYGQTCSPNGYNPVGGGYGCEVYNNRPEYNYAYYVPMRIYGNELVCVRYDLVQNYGYQYYGQTGGGCAWGNSYCNNQYSYQGSSCVNIGGQSWGQQYGLSGNIGFCW